MAFILKDLTIFNLERFNELHKSFKESIVSDFLIRTTGKKARNHWGFANDPGYYLRTLYKQTYLTGCRKPGQLRTAILKLGIKYGLEV